MDGPGGMSGPPPLEHNGRAGRVLDESGVGASRYVLGRTFDGLPVGRRATSGVQCFVPVDTCRIAFIVLPHHT